jgi:hypothetical protein
MRIIVAGIFFILLGLEFVFCQFPPPAGEPGTTAIHKDSSIFTLWASGCTVHRGYVDYTDTTISYGGSNRATFGKEADALEMPDENVVSLGDVGYALLTFDQLIKNGEGPDFAIFENGFSNEFLELAFVEVSSDGERFIRFPSVSYTQTSGQIPTFGTLDATKINNLAGKYRILFGTPFDLSDIQDSTGIDLMAISHVRVIDVGGCIQPEFASLDSQGNPVNDPWPTFFHTGGFDLDAAGVIHATNPGIHEKGNVPVKLYPNPVSNYLTIENTGAKYLIFCLTDLTGRIVINPQTVGKSKRVDLSEIKQGIYLAVCLFPDGTRTCLKVIRE